MESQDKLLVEKFLRKVPVFRKFSDNYLDQIAGEFSTIRFKKGEEIVFRADESTDLYIVLKGDVRVSLLSRDGNELILTHLREGDFFGEMSLIDGKSRSANVVAENDTSLGMLKREKFISTMKQEPQIAFDLLSALVERLRKADDMIETQASLSS